MTSDIVQSSGPSPSPEQLQALMRLMTGYRISQAMYVVAKLGIPDLLADGPRAGDELAQVTETNEAALYRVLRFLSGVGLFDEVSPRRFGLTQLGAGLRANVPGSIRSTTLMLLEEFKWRPWGYLLDSVRTGEVAFRHVHGMGLFDYLHEHPDASAIFDEAMTSNTAWSGNAISQAYDFSGVRRLVDVGGGRGLLLTTVLQAFPTMHGVLFDRPEVVEGAGPVLENAGVADRSEVVGGDFFEAVPPDGDAYVLRQIIHDWDDDQARAILVNCRRVMRPSGKVLVVERGIDPEYRHALPVLHLDLEMLVNLGGIQRTDAEYRALFAVAGLRLSRVVPLGDPLQFSVFEGVPV